MIRTSLLAAATLLAAAALSAGDYQPPRDALGRPELEGVWTNASLTTLSRPPGIESLLLTPERAAELERGNFHNRRAAADALPSGADREAPEAAERLPPVGNYNAAWVEPGTTYGVVRGEIRSSWIVDPPDGRVPFRPERPRQGRDRGTGPSWPADPEQLSLGERCLVGFGGTAGPPMLNVLYNNYYRIVQTKDHVAILVEMVHDARIVRLDAEHGPAGRWLGDSVGHWEGDTLVVETTGFHPAREHSLPLPYSSSARVVERISRVADDQLLYLFEVEDPEMYSRPLRGEMTFRKVPQRVFEYACHEGNYAVPNILRGARLAERDGDGAP